ncbi:hypothetical protein LCGC14_1640250 [marine sediment metagenome]|uniref:Tyr recombinase domain-containing protein n=1 Tax=marine sediment metagenome TaxID=412755 RepID=A0A0F9KFP4_9ZZZZ
MEQITRSNGRVYSLKANKNRFFFPKEYLKVYDLLKQKQQHTATCLINTGARINEIRLMRVEDIKFPDNKILDDKGNLTLKYTKCKATKGETRGKPRQFPISSQFSKYLKKYVRDHKLGLDDTLNILSTPAFNTGLKKASEKAQLGNPNDFSAHSLRKTMETWLMSLGVDGLKLTVHLGHDISTAAAHYVSPDIFNSEDRMGMRIILGDLYER